MSGRKGTDSTVECVVRGTPSARTEFVVAQVRHLIKLTESLDDDELRAVQRGGGELSPLLAIIKQESNREYLREHDALAAARARGLTKRHQLLEVEGGVLGTSEVAVLLGMSRQAVDLRRGQGKLLALDLGSRRKLYPRWQFSEDGVLDGVEEALAVLAETATPPWSCLRFFLGRTPRLGGERPLDLLRRGDLNPVLRAARVFDQHGAA